MKTKCPECGTICQLGNITGGGKNWSLVSIKEVGKGFVEIGSHAEHYEIGGHCHSHRVGKKQLLKLLGIKNGGN